MICYLKGLLLAMVLCLSATVVWAGSIDSPAGPTAEGSAMYTVTDVYNRINNGTAGTKRTTTFGEPTAAAFDAGAPKSTGHDLDDLYDLASERSRPAKTGQTLCYNAAGIQIDCPGTGQDGDLQKGVSWPSPRFTDNVNGTVTDNLTGLIWLKNANCTDTVGGVDKSSGKLTWPNALTWCNNLASGLCSLTDGSSPGVWRLPNVLELVSLIDWRYYEPALSNDAGTGQWTSEDAFTNVLSERYWVSTTYPPDKTIGWRVHIGYGNVDGYYKDSPEFYVWPVRGGQ